MENGDAILDRIHRGIGIDADADQVRRVEFETEAPVGYPLEELLPTLRGGTYEIVLRPRPVFNREDETA
ncbi:hypothetical protein D3C87_2029410 [compost metagenome]